MMKKLFAFTVLLMQFNVIAQTFSISKTNYPFYDIIEWKGRGAILLSKDQSGNTPQVYMILVNAEKKSVWEQHYNPQRSKTYYIAADNVRYVYFLRNLKPENGKIYFEQLNSAGNVKSTSVSITSVIRNIGFDVNELELINVVTTDKSLVHHFRYFDKKEKIYTELATFMTHNNMLVYATVLGRVSEEEVKNGRANNFQYVGFDTEHIFFADYATTKSGKGWNVIKYNSKGQEQSRTFLKFKKDKLAVAFQTSGFGTTGAYYLGSEKSVQYGLLSYLNGNFYCTIMNNSSGKQKLELYQIEGEDYKLLNTYELTGAGKKASSIGVYVMNEALGYRVFGGDAGDFTVALFWDGGTPIVNKFTESVVFNPSRMIISDKKEFFAVTLQTENLFFDPAQLKSAADVVEFELLKK